MKYPLSELRTDDSNSDDLRIVLMGSAERIVQTTHQLHRLRFADINDWSPPLPLPNSNELFSLLTRRSKS